MRVVPGLVFREPGKPIEIGERMVEPTFVVNKISKRGFVYYAIDGDKRGWVTSMANFIDDIRAGKKIAF